MDEEQRSEPDTQRKRSAPPPSEQLRAEERAAEARREQQRWGELDLAKLRRALKKKDGEPL